MKHVRSIVFILSFLTYLPFASSAEQDLQVRLEKSLNNINSLSGVEVSWLDTLSIKDPATLKVLKANEFTRTFQYTYTASGQKYHAVCELISGTKNNLAKQFESTFDGKIYSTYSADKRYMTTGSKDAKGDRGQSANSLLIAPFLFLTRADEDCPECMLRFTDINSGLFAKGLNFPPGQEADGLLKISMPGLPFGKQPTTWEMAIDAAGDSFTPKMFKHICPGIKSEVVIGLLNYTNLGAYQFPSRMEITQYSYPETTPPTVFSTELVVLVSARIPDQIADSVFRLDGEEKSAAVVWDWDQKKLGKMAPERAKVQAIHGTASKVLLLMILFTTLLIPIAIMVVKKFASREK